MSILAQMGIFVISTAKRIALPLKWYRGGTLKNWKMALKIMFLCIFDQKLMFFLEQHVSNRMELI